ncbi:MAG: hypothetical protein Q8O67_13930 [Deltaproteobacteria bacterium]|nr:hypothetical protein [Deltaproteobacteria bacterium]
MRIALATCRELPGLDDDDHGYLAALRARGATVTLPIWDDEAASWDVDVVVVRSTWDYSERKDAFVAWALRVDAHAVLLNPSSMVRWNTDKQLYLSDLAEQGVPTVPTAWLAKGDAVVDVKALVGGRGFSDVVIKPIVGAGSRDTIRVDAADVATIAQRFVNEQLPRQALMVQPFLPRIAEGEVSLIFLETERGLGYSHAVIKQPKGGDFRSQPEFGSKIERHTPTSTEREIAERALHFAGGRPLFARVDLVTGLDGQPTLIELELVEPCLYLGWSDDGAAALADATLRRAREKR